MGSRVVTALQSGRVGRFFISYWCYFVLAVVLLAAAYLRFIAITRIGLRGDDTFHYWALAKEWAAGNYIHGMPGKIEVHRTVILYLYSMVGKLFAFQDWAIKVFNASLDVLNILLVFLITRLISRNRVLAVCAATVFAFLPLVIAYSRTELLHTPSITFLLLTVTWFLVFLRSTNPRLKYLFLSLAGVFTALCFGVHEDLLLYIPGFVALLVFDALLVGGFRQDNFIKLFINEAIYLGSLALTFFALGFLTWMQRHTGEAMRFSPFAHGSLQFYLETVRGMIGIYTSRLFLTLFWISLAIQLVFLSLAIIPISKRLVEKFRSEPISLQYFLPIILIASYITLFPFAAYAEISLQQNAFPKILPRLFLPGLPLVVIHIFLWYDLLLLKITPTKIRHALMILLCALIVYVNLTTSPRTNSEIRALIGPEKQRMYTYYAPQTITKTFLDQFDPNKYPVSEHRIIYDFLKDKVSSRAKLLVMPLVKTRRGLQAYFGDNAVYMSQCADESLDEYIKSNNIKYLIFAGFHFERKRFRGEAAWRTCYNMGTDTPYALKREINYLQNFVRKNRLPVIYKRSNTLIFSLNGAK